MTNFKEKIKNAYLLFYDRIVPFSEESQQKKEESKENAKDCELEVENSKKTTVNPLEEFHLELIEKNFEFHIHRNVFSTEFFKFITNLIMGREYEKNRDYIEFPFIYDPLLEKKKYFDLELLKLGVIFLLTCVIRDKERNCIVLYLPFIQQQMKKVK